MVATAARYAAAMTLEVHPATTDAELERLLAVRNVIDQRPLTLAGWNAELGGTLASCALLATLDGRDVGAGRVAWGAMGRDSSLAFVDIWVLKDARERGVGSRLWADLGRFARDRGIERAGAPVVEDDVESMAFAERRGLVITTAGQLGHLDLRDDPSADPTPLPDGITLTTLRERPELEHAVYELENLVRPEIPALTGEPMPTYEAWQAEMTSDDGFLDDLCLVAQRGETVVGVVQMFDGGDRVAFIGMTAVHPSARRMGLARALKLEMARRAATAGWRRIETYNDGSNERIRALNESLGYVYLPRVALLKGPIPVGADATSSATP
jgi:GNAT superfamily N-acetyltransferase